ncbi:sn-glycerol-3-phosphate ABC transporter ATP-binding protein UgpC [Devosia sp. PTR5]|uniref:Sn-glycerol-3-phosphate ABC transporter ATP-binding protein UgpC n=1 Tax=Devosia oryzisoli TaxID=2774138 RepID=A0A927IT30_9HYPH|nr:sn-glycerol-3-phosphate ABC transporter ATP-binding protein UgpC [Devosia oryzisoli]MBD8066124.1 sn-glycerol-3-phosphate ABC transporter ATP-binding protein UgpC [Devosia oryzisoli]
MPEIELRHVSKNYGGVSVIDDLSLSMETGEFVVLVGPSGCGKSTLLRMIAGLEDISGGEITIGGKIVNNMPAKQRDLAMVFQSYALYPHMKVADNMSFALKLAGVSKAEREQRVAEAARILGLESLLERLPRELSGGQRQRVAMGRAIVRNPRAFLFDEPLSNLDAKLRVRMRGEIKALHQRLGKTTVYVTHDQTEAMTMADTIVVLNGGRIEQAGAPLELYNNPVNLFVAGFIGSPEMNLLTVTTLGPEARGVSLPGGEVLPIPRPLDLPAGTEIVYGIRPQYISLGQGSITARADVVEPTGEAQEVRASIGGTEVSAVIRDAELLSPGQALTLVVDADKVLLFDKQSGERLDR